MNHSPMHLLHRVWQCAGEAFQQAMAEGDLTPRQFAALSSVNEHEGLSQADLVARTGIDRSTVTDLIRRMRKKGLLRRRRARNDARAYTLSLTDEGRRMLRLAAPLVQQVDKRILDALPPENRDRFLRDLKSIMKSLTAEFEHKYLDFRAVATQRAVRVKSQPSRSRGLTSLTVPSLPRQLPTRLTP
jgi:MarR family transcriptional regulator, temperature-dependent positive regulator of motility